MCHLLFGKSKNGLKLEIDKNKNILKSISLSLSFSLLSSLFLSMKTTQSYLLDRSCCFMTLSSNTHLLHRITMMRTAMTTTRTMNPPAPAPTYNNVSVTIVTRQLGPLHTFSQIDKLSLTILTKICQFCVSVWQRLSVVHGTHRFSNVLPFDWSLLECILVFKKFSQNFLSKVRLNGFS